jgi:hypothetical protein
VTSYDVIGWIFLLGGIALVISLINRLTDSQSQRTGVTQVTSEQRDTARREFLKTAKRMQAKILSASQFGMVNLLPNLSLSLRVEAPEGAYDVDVEHHVDFIDLPRFTEGCMVDVYVDPENREHVVVAG